MASSSMKSIDLLSITTTSADVHNLEHITEEKNQCDNEAIRSASPSLLSSTAEQQNPVDPSAIYQIDFDVEHLGKNKPQSKRMAMWKYGTSSATAAGGTTVASHEAMLTWSTHSGKYTISVDGEEVFNNVAKGSVLEYKWKWCHAKACVVEDDYDGESVAMRIVACRKPPVRSSKNFRCYEFIIGGRVFRDLPVNGSKEDEWAFTNEDNARDDGKLMSILDIIEPGWRASGFA